MTTADQIAALGAALEKCRDFMRHKEGCRINPGGPIMAALGDPDPRPCSCGFDAALALPVPTPADLATLARWAETGELVEQMKCRNGLTPPTSYHPYEWTCGSGDGHGNSRGIKTGPTALAALRAAIEPQGPNS